jgi:phospholipid transport system substrate-binding protein
MKFLCAAACLSLVLTVPMLAWAASAAPIITSFHSEVIEVMKKGAELGQKGRVQALTPVANKAFDVPLMARNTVGTARWNSWSAEQRDSYAKVFRDFLIATYAARFKGYSGERFEPAQEKAEQGKAWITSAILKGSGERFPVRYLMVENKGSWRIVDVYLDGSISELANWKSQLAKPLREGGYEGVMNALTNHIQRLENTTTH